MTVSWDSLTPIDQTQDDEQNKQKKAASWDDLQPEGTNQEQTYQRPAGDKGWEISATPKDDTTLLGRLGKTLKWVAQTPIYAYMQGNKSVRAAELNAKEIFHPLDNKEKTELNELESEAPNNFGIPQNVKYADENITNLPERASNWIKNYYTQSVEQLPNTVEVMKSGGIGSAVLGGAGLLGGAVVGAFKGNPVQGALDGLRLGVRLGGGAGATKKSFELEAGSARQELKQFRDKDGNPLPDDLVNAASIGVGSVNAGLEVFGLHSLLKTLPGADKILSNATKDTVKEIATNDILKNKLIDLGKKYAEGVSTETGTEMLQEMSNIVADEISKKIAGNYDATPLHQHLSRIVNTGIAALGPAMFIGGAGTTMTAANILRQNGMTKEQANSAAANMSDDAKVNLINDNENTLVKMGENHFSDLQRQEVENDFFKKAVDAGVDENKALSASKLVGVFAKKFGSNVDQMKDWYNKLMITNKPLEGGVSMNVPAEGNSETNQGESNNNQVENNVNADKLEAGKAYKINGTDTGVFQEYSDNGNPVFKFGEGDNTNTQEFDKADSFKEINKVSNEATVKNDKALFQRNVAYAGATEAEAQDAAKQWKEKGTDSTYFKKWFGDSKVVDDEGKPLLVYHGSMDNFDTFSTKERGRVEKSINTKKAFWFTDDDHAADAFANIHRENKILNLQADKHRVGVGYNNPEVKQQLDKQIESLQYKNSERYNVFLSMKNPLEVDYEGYEYDTKKVDKLIQKALKQGHDGLIIKNINDEGGTATQYAVFNPEQIKSIYNQGSFSKDTGNIYYQKENIEKTFGDTPKNIEGMLSEDVKNVLSDNLVDKSEFKFEGAKIYGSFLKGTNTKTSDLDLLVQYSGSMREDDAFNMFADAKLKLQNVLGNDVKVDINPINTEKSGTIEEHLKYLDSLEGKDKTYFQSANKDNFDGAFQLPNDKEIAQNIKDRKQKAISEYLGYFQEGQDKNIIGVMQNANPSTLVHEMGHLFLSGLNEFAATDKEAQKALSEVNEWLGYKNGGYTEEQHEKFAQGFEAYLHSGKAPSNSLREVFNNFKEWLQSIYKHAEDLGVKLTPEVQRVFDNIFSEKSEGEQEVNALVQKAKNISLSDKLTDSQTRHKEAAYDILSAALGKNKKWLKSILESDSDNPKILKNKENIELALEHTDDKISAGNGFLPEWTEFFTEPDYYMGSDYDLAQAAYDAIVNKSYKTELNQFDFLNETDAQYQYLLDQFKRSTNRDIPLAAFWQWVEGVEPEFQEIYCDKYEKDTAYIERFERLDKFEQAKEKILKAAHEANSYSLNSVDAYREIVKTTMNSLRFLNPMDKAKLTANILDVPSASFLEARINGILDIAKTMEDIQYKRKMMDKIHQELQFTKNIKQNNKTVGKYDYTTNKAFTALRELDRLSQEEVNERRFDNIVDEEAKGIIFALDDAVEEDGLPFDKKLINKFIQYKANGIAYTSTEAAKSLYDDIVQMKLAGKESKNEQEFNNKLNLVNEVIELVRVLDKKQAAKGGLKGYLKLAANWESMLNGVFNKNIKDKYSLLEAQRNTDAWINKEKDGFKAGVAEIYGKKLLDFDSEILKNLNEKFTFLQNVEDIENIGEFRQVGKEMNKMEMILAYMWDKNEVLHERLVNQFGELELERMFNELSSEDMKLGDLMMQTVSKYHPFANEVYIKKYGIDMPRVENYFPSKVERVSEIDLLTDYSMKSTDPSFIKHRSGGTKLSMAFDNPVKMLFEHIDNMGRFINMTELLDKQNKIFKNTTLKDMIEEKYDKDTYKELFKMLMNNSYKQQGIISSWYGNILNDIASNWLIGNVAFKPSIGIKQLLSSSNYASEMPPEKWVAGYIKAWLRPKETVEYMKKIPYLKARFESGGQNEFLKNEINNSTLAKTRKLKDFLTLNIRLGDIGAIAFGGRPYLEYLMKDKGLSEEAAIKEFLNHTQRTMQASETSTLSNFQIEMSKSKYGGKLLTAYKNAQWQYLRMAGDSIVSFANGDMSAKQMSKTLFMYMFMNPFLYRSATSLSMLTLLMTGSSDDLKKDVIDSIFDLNADAISVLGECYQYAMGVLANKGYEAVTGDKLGKTEFPEKVPLLGDLQKHISDVAKEDVSFEDYLNFGTYGAQIFAGLPVNALGTSLAGAGDIAQGDFLKGGLKLAGWSDKTAANAVGEKEPKHKHRHKHHKHS